MRAFRLSNVGLMINNMFAFGMPGGSEWLLIALVILLLFGAKRLPELARGMGKSIREFKKATSEVEDDIREALKDDPKPAKKDSEVKSEPASSDEDKKSQ